MKRIASVGSVVLLILGLVASSLLLITAQHRARGLFIEIEREQQIAQRLEAEAKRLRVELGRVSQPAMVDAAALRLGLKRVELARTVFVPQPQVPDEVRR
jgi:cell division protein FtsL